MDKNKLIEFQDRCLKCYSQNIGYGAVNIAERELKSNIYCLDCNSGYTLVVTRPKYWKMQEVEQSQ